MLVQGEGPLDAKIVIIGEAPGYEEEKVGRPFIGGSGQLLDQILGANGINRRQCYVTNIMQVRPPGNDFGVFYDDPKKRSSPSSLLLDGIRRLGDELRQVRPNIIIPLGSEPLRAVTGLRSIEKWRGSIVSSNFGKVVASYHPAAVLRTYQLRPLLNLDIRKAAKQSTFPDVRLPSHKFHIDPSFDFVMQWLRAIRSGQLVSFDIETVGDLVRCLGIAISRHEAMCIPFMSSPYRFRPGTMPSVLSDGISLTQVSSHWTESEEYAILTELERIFEDSTIQKAAQNYPFDSTALEKQFGLVCKGLRLDTMLGFHACYCELPKGLDTLCSIYTEVPYYSDYNSASDYDVWRYNCYDCVVTHEIVPPIEADLESHNLTEFYRNHLQPAMLALTRAENRGIVVDQTIMSSERERLLNEIGPTKTDKRVGTLTQCIRDAIQNQEFNPNSPKQMAELFYTRLKLPVQLNYKTKRPTADKNARDQLAKRYPEHAVLFGLLDDWSTKETLVTGFLSRKPRQDGRIYTHYNLAGTLTGRIASSDPIFEVGTNLTNIPRGAFRRIFLPDSEADPTNPQVLVKADLKSAEWMVVCWACPIDRLIKKYAENPEWDVHRWAAHRVHSIPEAIVTKQQRAEGKNGVYGGNYGMQPNRAAITWKVPVDKARFILDRWHAEVPEIRVMYWGKIQKSVSTSRSLTNFLGRKRMFFDRIPFPPSPLDQIYRDAYSHYAQSTVADIINRAFALMDHFFPESECRLLLQVHDEIVGTCRVSDAPRFVKLFKSFMEYELIIPDAPAPLTIPAEVTVGPNWFDQEPLKELQ